MITAAEATSRSYRNRFQDGDPAQLLVPVQLTETTWEPEFRVVERREVPAGMAVQVLRTANAGSNGIVAFVRLAGTNLTGEVSTGYLASI